MLLRLSCICLLGISLLGQSSKALFESAAPHIDEALRERVTFFYQSHVEGKFRQADTVVHEDSKDAFFVADKNKYKGFVIGKITYAENFTKARVVVTVDTNFMMPGAGNLPVKVPVTTSWNYDAGEWWWYVPPEGEQVFATPFGTMRPGPGEEPAFTLDKLKNMPSADDIVARADVDKTTVELDCAGGGTESVEVLNRMPGKIFISLSEGNLDTFQTEAALNPLGRNISACSLFILKL